VSVAEIRNSGLQWALPPLGHIGYVVENLEADTGTFLGFMGIESFRIYDFVPNRVWADGKELSGCALRIAIGSIKGSEVKVELIQPVSGETPHALFLRERGPALHHIAFPVAEYEDWRRRYRSLGARIVFEAETEDEIIGYRRCFYARAEGMAGLVEITEIPRKRRSG
jgi:catechol 2,3-dioxygenase-like lactoylglutathione lyase family enzyme